MNSLDKLIEISKDFNIELDKTNRELEETNREKRINIIAQNGNEGYHYKFDEETKIETTPLQRKGMPVYSGVITYFPDALKEVSKCSLAGQKQHNQGDKLYWDKNKSFDNEDAMIRHLMDHSKNPVDEDGILHLAKMAWRALATLQIYLEKK